jgi:mevalonate kinase
MIIKSPAKTILFGEHAVVYGQIAICTTLGLFTRAEFIRYSGVRLVIDELGIDTMEMLNDPTTRAFYELVKKLGISDLSVTVKSEIPIGMGLGSSASFACCISAGLLIHAGMDRDNLDLDEINKHAFEMEKVFHGNSSGLDNTVICFGGSNVYRIGEVVEKIITPPVKLFLVDTSRGSCLMPRNRKEY